MPWSRYNQTIIVYSSDNGGPSWTCSHHLAANNWPLRGSKATDLEVSHFWALKCVRKLVCTCVHDLV
jgi:hypothetical protein